MQDATLDSRAKVRKRPRWEVQASIAFLLVMLVSMRTMRKMTMVVTIEVEDELVTASCCTK